MLGLEIVTLLIQVAVILFISHLLWNSIQVVFFCRVPYVPSPRRNVTQIVALLGPKPGEKIVDLGCGDARILLAAWRKEPKGMYCGYESSLYPYLLAKFRIWRNKAPIQVYRKNFFHADLRNTDKIYMFLLPRVMDRLLPKLQKELRPGTMLVSTDFMFSNKTPARMIALDEKAKLGKRLLVYQF